MFQEALKDCFKDAKNPATRGGNFVRRSEKIKPYVVSKAVDSIREKNPVKKCMVD
jgi:hypothetical protein